MSHTGKNIEEIADLLREGYVAMSEINLEESEASAYAAVEAEDICTDNLTECE